MFCFLINFKVFVYTNISKPPILSLQFLNLSLDRMTWKFSPLWNLSCCKEEKTGKHRGLKAQHQIFLLKIYFCMLSISLSLSLEKSREKVNSNFQIKFFLEKRFQENLFFSHWQRCPLIHQHFIFGLNFDFAENRPCPALHLVPWLFILYFCHYSFQIPPVYAGEFGILNFTIIV